MCVCVCVCLCCVCVCVSSVAIRLLGSLVRIPLRAWLFVFFFFVVRQADHSFRGVLMYVCVCVCVCLIVYDIEYKKSRLKPDWSWSATRKIKCHRFHFCKYVVTLLTLRRLMSYIYIYIYIWSTHS